MKTKFNFGFCIFLIFICLFLFLSMIYLFNSGSEHVLLSFDTEVPDNNSIMLNLLSILDNNDIRATFFMTTDFAQKYPKMVDEVIQRNHEISCHTKNHFDLTNLDKEELLIQLEGCRLYFKNNHNVDVIGFRAPYRKINKDVFMALNKFKFSYDASLFSFWSFLYAKPTINEIYTSINLGFPLDDYILLEFLHLPPKTYFNLISVNKKYKSLSFHPHIIMEYSQEFNEFLNNSNGKFITHKDYLEMYNER